MMYPVYQDALDDQWYFYAETWADTYGPFWTEAEARKELKLYCESMLKEQTRGES